MQNRRENKSQRERESVYGNRNGIGIYDYDMMKKGKPEESITLNSIQSIKALLNKKYCKPSLP